MIRTEQVEKTVHLILDNNSLCEVSKPEAIQLAKDLLMACDVAYITKADERILGKHLEYVLFGPKTCKNGEYGNVIGYHALKNRDADKPGNRAIGGKALMATTTGSASGLFGEDSVTIGKFKITYKTPPQSPVGDHVILKRESIAYSDTSVAIGNFIVEYVDPGPKTASELKVRVDAGGNEAVSVAADGPPVHSGMSLDEIQEWVKEIQGRYNGPNDTGILATLVADLSTKVANLAARVKELNLTVQSKKAIDAFKESETYRKIQEQVWTVKVQKCIDACNEVIAIYK